MGKFSLPKLLADRGLSTKERQAVLEDLFVFGKDNQFPFLVRMSILLILSTVIATAGLLSDSAAVVIGAMLVAPLMNPVMAAAGAVVMGWPKRFYGALWLVTAMGAGAIVLSSVITLLAPELVFIPEQVLARTRPTYFDLLIALAAGSAGAYTVTRKETSAIPGVAVAVALLPPLASAGILATTGEFELTLRAVVLFLTNLIAMVLSGALTFMAVGVSPPVSRKKTAAFARSQISLFVILTIAVSIPLWFYSEKILFNARYKAAKSEVLQGWLKENRLELVDVEILNESQSLLLKLVGPSPPVNIEELYEKVMANNPEIEQGFNIRYSWTQKVAGVWPQSSNSVTEVVKEAEIGVELLIGSDWVWRLTQYDAESATRPTAEEVITLSFSSKGKFEVTAPCGRRTGKYNFGGRLLDIKMNRNLFSGCRNDAALKVFLDDLARARIAYVEDSSLQVTLAGSEGIIYFDGKTGSE